MDRRAAEVTLEPRRLRRATVVHPEQARSDRLPVLPDHHEAVALGGQRDGVD